MYPCLRKEFYLPQIWARIKGASAVGVAKLEHRLLTDTRIVLPPLPDYNNTVDELNGQTIVTSDLPLAVASNSHRNNNSYFDMPSMEALIVSNELQVPESQSDGTSSSQLGHSTQLIDFDIGMFPDNSSLGDFLADIMMPISSTDMASHGMMSTGFRFEQYSPRDVLDFSLTDNLDLNDFDFGLIDSFRDPRPLVPVPVTAIEDPSYPPSRDADDGQLSGIDNVGIEAFKKSLWRWVPAKDERGLAEQMNLSLADNEVNDVRLNNVGELKLSLLRLDQTCRDRIMAMLFSTCEPAAVSRIVSSFPSADLLDGLMQEFISSHTSGPNPWIHFPTFRPRFANPEFAGIIVAAGAVFSPLSAIRKLGFAIQEAVRLVIPKRVCQC